MQISVGAKEGGVGEGGGRGGGNGGEGRDGSGGWIAWWVRGWLGVSFFFFLKSM